MPLDGWKIAEILLALLTGVLAWVGQRLIVKFDELEEAAVLKVDFDKAIEDIRSERKAMHEENKKILERIEGKIDIAAQATLVERVNNIEEKIERIASYGEQTKHLYVDPYIRAVDVLKDKVDRLEKRSDR